MADPVDMIVPFLREMRTETAALHEQTRVEDGAIPSPRCVEERAKP